MDSNTIRSSSRADRQPATSNPYLTGNYAPVGKEKTLTSPQSIGSLASVLAVGSVASLASVGSMASLGSIGSIASIGSVGSIASTHRVGAILNVPVADKLAAALGRRLRTRIQRQQGHEEPGTPAR